MIPSATSGVSPEKARVVTAHDALQRGELDDRAGDESALHSNAVRRIVALRAGDAGRVAKPPRRTFTMRMVLS